MGIFMEIESKMIFFRAKSFNRLVAKINIGI